MANKILGKVFLRNVRLAFPRLTTPEKQANASADAQPKFSAAFILEKDSPTFAENKKAIEAAITEVAKDKWQDKAKTNVDSFKATDKLPLHDGNAKAETIGYAGNLYVNASSPANNPPSLVTRNPKVHISRDKVNGVAPSEKELYAGCYVNAVVVVWAQDNKFGKRINASLTGVQFYDNGAPFTGNAPAEESDFEVLDDATDWTDDGESLM